MLSLFSQSFSGWAGNPTKIVIFRHICKPADGKRAFADECAQRVRFLDARLRKIRAKFGEIVYIYYIALS